VNEISLALYVDLENLSKCVDFERLLKQLSGDGRGVVFAVKAAYGNAYQIATKLREQMRDHSFRFIDTPHLAGKKNRADLMISVDAFERLHINIPPVDRYVFVSGDADFSVIMDKLRSYGKQVWLVCRRGDQHRTILSRSCDKMLFIEDFTGSREPSKVAPPSEGRAETLLKLALLRIGHQGLPVNLAVVGNTMRQMDREFTFSGSGFKRLTDLAQHVEKKGILRLGRDGKGEVQIEDVDDSSLEVPSPTLSVVTSEPSPPATAAGPVEWPMVGPVVEDSPPVPGVLPGLALEDGRDGGATEDGLAQEGPSALVEKRA
jgi:hypothetical protein